MQVSSLVVINPPKGFTGKKLDTGSRGIFTHSKREHFPWFPRIMTKQTFIDFAGSVKCRIKKVEAQESVTEKSFIQLHGTEGRRMEVTYDSINAIFVLFIGCIIYKFTIPFPSVWIWTHVWHVTWNKLWRSRASVFMLGVRGKFFNRFNKAS